MIRSPQSMLIPARNLTAALLLTALVAGTYQMVAKYGVIDAYASYKTKPQFDPRLGVRLDKVHFRHYHGDQLVTEAKIGRLDVRKDRQVFDLTNVSEGTYYSKSKQLHYAANNGNWDGRLQVLNLSEDVHVWTDDIDLHSGTVVVDQREKKLQSPTPIRGKLYDGQVLAQDFRYDIESGAYETGKIQWDGNLVLMQDGDGKKKPRTWHVESERTNNPKENKNVTEYFDAVATDQDYIIKAPKVVYDKEKQVATATGRVQMFSGKANLTADQVVVYRKERRAVFTGNVVMLVKPKAQEKDPPKIVEIPPFRPVVPDQVSVARPAAPANDDQKKQRDELRSPDSIRKYPFVVHSDSIEYWYRKGDRHAKITGHPQARQDFPDGRWRHVWSHNADWDGEKNSLYLTSEPGKKDQMDVRMKNSLNESVLSTWIRMTVNEEDEDVSSYEAGKSKADFTEDEDETDENSTTTPISKPEGKPDGKPDTKAPPSKTGPPTKPSK